jgi:hypothetical protein
MISPGRSDGRVPANRRSTCSFRADFRSTTRICSGMVSQSAPPLESDSSVYGDMSRTAYDSPLCRMKEGRHCRRSRPLLWARTGRRNCARGSHGAARCRSPLRVRRTLKSIARRTHSAVKAAAPCLPLSIPCSFHTKVPATTVYPSTSQHPRPTTARSTETMPIAVPRPATNTSSLKDSKAHLARPKNDDGSPLYPDYMRELISSHSGFERLGTHPAVTYSFLRPAGEGGGPRRVRSL